MKLLKRIKLINWHYFTNITINTEGSTLITGDNGSGKSTILDAIQYVLVADLRNIRFNISANENTNRDLIGYVRCKTGSENSAAENSAGYERTGDVTSYVVLEFYDQSKDKCFLLGAVIDAYKESGYTANFFKIEDCMISDDLFLDGNRPRNIREFKQRVKPLKATVYPSAEHYREDMLVKLGSLKWKFFDTFVRALSFKPITNIREFVYNYILDEKDLNIGDMRDNFERYREYKALVDQTKERIQALEDIRAKFGQLTSQKETALIQDYIILQARRDDAQMRQRAEEGKAKVYGDELARKEEELLSSQQRLNELDEQYGQLRDAMNTNLAYQLSQGLKNDISALQDKINALASRKAELIKAAEHEREQTEMFLQLAGSDRLKPDQEDVMRHWCKALYDMDVFAIAALMPDVKEAFAEASAELDAKAWEIRSKLNEIGKEEENVREVLDNLKNKKLTYGKNVTALRALLRDKIKDKTGRDITPDILCELIDIKDERWRNAIEGFLNTQRFDLIVEPQYFDYCLAVYERYKREYGIHGVGLVNTGKITNYIGDAMPNSLATEVVSDNKYALAYVNRLMGNVIKCDDEQQLKEYSRSITPTCMSYANHTARQIDFHVYETPYIGQGALIKQKEASERRLAELLGQKEAMKQDARSVEALKRCMSGKEERMFIIADRLPVIAEIKEVEEALKQKQEKLATLDMSETEAIQRKIDGVKGEMSAMQAKMGQINRDMGQLEGLIQSAQQAVNILKQRISEIEQEIAAFAQANADIMDKAQKRYEGEVKKREPEAIAESFSSARKGTDTVINDQLRVLERVMQAYNDAYQFWGRIDGNDISDYQKQYDKLMESELPQYEEKIAIAQKRAEEEFKTHFLFKLRESIEDAYQQFRELNDALRDVRFGNDAYEFLIHPKDDFRRFYEMIMDASAASQNFSIFDMEFSRKHKEAMDYLLDNITCDDQEKLNDFMKIYADYRSYLDYDIRITSRSASGENESYLFSRVCREKSGGETQTPYYVAIVASFAQIYRIVHDNNSIRLMVFDEAFNRMDGERIDAMLRFMRDMGMQVIIAAPTEKCQFITPHMDTTLLVLRDGSYSWLENYRRFMEMLREEMA